ncbi:MAG: carboxylating nicotinate-nucleotide diphosphorylase [Gemmatimonadales bacterium]|jgi:nicotinate-nucleotide pyrophosphorylase (carboxylating)|nr:MAG: carboxylating nicotinate-nucleotide diphosphorylase [Gemmatimonadales bacterium]
MNERDLRLRIGADARRVAEIALAEDGSNDLTSNSCVPPDFDAAGILEFRDGGVLAGTVYADAVAQAAGLPPVIWQQASGTLIAPGTEIGLLRGPLAQILRAERPLLNLLQRAAGIATTTRSFVDAVAGTAARILHTRKTAPGLRLLDVSAVLAGGGGVHRLDLATTMMVKDNHWRALARSGRRLDEAITAARAAGATGYFVEVENEEQVDAACSAGADRLLVDNQSPETVRSWGQRARVRHPGIVIEATGGISLRNVRAFAEAGADFISIGALTHSVTAVDISLEVSEQ